MIELVILYEVCYGEITAIYKGCCYWVCWRYYCTAVIGFVGDIIVLLLLDLLGWRFVIMAVIDVLESE